MLVRWKTPKITRHSRQVLNIHKVGGGWVHSTAEINDISADWNLISRTIIPVISQPDPILNSNTNGIGDITEELFFSPLHSGALIWGAGPVFTVPSATDPILGTGRVLLGPTIVLLETPGHWVIGVLANGATIRAR